MQDDLQGLWKNILSDISKEISTPKYYTFFKPTKLLSIEENVATIAAPSLMVSSWIEKGYAKRIEELFESQTKQKIRAVFIAQTTEGPSKKETPLFPDKQEEKHQTIGHLPRVRQEYTFETLAVSDSNNLAFESAKTVSRNPGSSYNPLFIYGPVGVGKTHLMQAIANFVYKQNPDVKIVYITSEEFTNEVVEAIRGNDTARMKRKFRSANLLIIDDVQFIAGKDRVQEELFHTFNSLIDAGGQIVLSSDRPPSEIKKLETRLSSRFAGGLTVDIQSPDFELRTAILLKKAEKFGYELPIDIAKEIAERQLDVRSLEGLLLRLITEATTKNQSLAERIQEGALKTHEEIKGPLHAEDVIKYACDFYHIKPTQLKGPKRDASLVRARQITMFLLKTELGLTFVEIGNVLGGRDHTTIMYGVEKMEKLVDSETNLREEILGITKSLRG